MPDAVGFRTLNDVSVPIILILLGLALIGAEFLVGDLTLLMFGLAALLTGAVAFTGAGYVVLAAIFAVSVVILMLAVRPPLRKRIAPKTNREVECRPELLAGRHATVVEAVGPDSGLVKLAGELWSARPLMSGARFAEGDRVTVVSIDGNIAFIDKEI